MFSSNTSDNNPSKHCLCAFSTNPTFTLFFSLHPEFFMTMAALKPTRLNKLLTTLWCGALLRKGPLCCGINCSCFNDVENPEASQARAKECVSGPQRESRRVGCFCGPTF